MKRTEAIEVPVYTEKVEQKRETPSFASGTFEGEEFRRSQRYEVTFDMMKRISHDP
jgi:hypothetical protein